MFERRWITREEIAEIWDGLGEHERAANVRAADKLENPLGMRA